MYAGYKPTVWISPIYNCGAVGDENEQIIFWGTDETKYGFKNRLLRNASFWWRHTGWRFAVKDDLFFCPILWSLTSKNSKNNFLNVDLYVVINSHFEHSSCHTAQHED